MTFSYEEAMSSSTKYFNGDELASKIFIDKYALRDNSGNLLEDTPEKAHKRLAKEFARIEQKYENCHIIDHNKEILKTINTLSFVINHMENEIKSKCMYLPENEIEECHFNKSNK